MKINRIDINTLNSIEFIDLIYIDPKDITINDLIPGYIIKTFKDIRDQEIDNHFLILGNEQLRKYDILSKGDENIEIAGVRPSDGLKEMSYLSFQSYVNTWPFHNRFECFNIVGVWCTNIDVKTINNARDLNNIFIKYNIQKL